MRAQAVGGGGGYGSVVAIRNGVGFVGFDNCTVAKIRVRALRRQATHSAVQRSALRGSAVRDSVGFLGFGGTLCTQPGVVRCSVTVSAYPSAAPGVPIVGNRCGWAPSRAWVACGVQTGDGGLVHISNGGTGNVSVVGSTLTGITVRAHC
jgi:hypothetical protein